MNDPRRAVAAALILASSIPSPVRACIHGATGLEQTGILSSTGQREEAIGLKLEAGDSAVKIFVGPRGRKPDVAVLSADQAKEHQRLQGVAAAIQNEGSRGVVAFEPQPDRRITPVVEDVTALSWADIAKKLNIPVNPPGYETPEANMERWVDRVRKEGRALWAAKVTVTDQVGLDRITVAARFQYGNPGEALLDKWLENWANWHIPTVLRHSLDKASVAGFMQCLLQQDPDLNDPAPLEVQVQRPIQGDAGYVNLSAAGSLKVRLRGDVIFMSGDAIGQRESNRKTKIEGCVYGRQKAESQLNLRLAEIPLPNFGSL